MAFNPLQSPGASRIEVSYDINPPSGLPTTLPPSGTRSFSVGDSEPYYKSLFGALQAAKVEMGKEFTAWRDAVGDLEKVKEKQMKDAKVDDDEEEDQPEDQV